MTQIQNTISSTSSLPSIVMLDNLDSFTYNLVDEFRCLGYQPTIYRNTLSVDFIIEKIEQQLKENTAGVILVLSPGPGDPSHAGCLMALIKKAIGRCPILGICLGHQALIQHYGGTIGRAAEIVHGKSSAITHLASGAFANITNPLPVARYHSLVATTMPASLTQIAEFKMTNNDGKTSVLPMAVEHKQDAVLGFQFHPESILTTYGSNLLAQSLTHLSTMFSTMNTSTKQVTQGANDE